MSEVGWEHIILAAIAAIPATIAAVSSVRNGRAIKNGHDYTKLSRRLDISSVLDAGRGQAQLSRGQELRSERKRRSAKGAPGASNLVQ